MERNHHHTDRKDANHIILLLIQEEIFFVKCSRQLTVENHQSIDSFEVKIKRLPLAIFVFQFLTCGTSPFGQVCQHLPRFGYKLHWSLVGASGVVGKYPPRAYEPWFISLHPCCYSVIDKYHLNEKGTERNVGNLKYSTYTFGNILRT